MGPSEERFALFGYARFCFAKHERSYNGKASFCRASPSPAGREKQSRGAEAVYTVDALEHLDKVG